MLRCEGAGHLCVRGRTLPTLGEGGEWARPLGRRAAAEMSLDLRRGVVLIGTGAALVLSLVACDQAGRIPSSSVDDSETSVAASRMAEPTPTPTGVVATETVVKAGTARGPSDTPSPAPTVTPTEGPTASLEPTREVRTVTLTIVYDNNTYGMPETEKLRTAWGFACWVETEEATVLFDTGGDGATLMHNLQELDLDPERLDAVVLSHAHRDHTGGLEELLAAGYAPAVYAPASFSRSFKEAVRIRTELFEVTDGSAIAPGIRSTGEIGAGIIEQALVVDTSDGLVVVTGCAHPGVVEMVRAADKSEGDKVALVVGGFHLGGASRARIEGIIAELRDLGVRRAAPCHCTGDEARRMFSQSFGDDCVLAGVGWSSQFVLDVD